MTPAQLAIAFAREVTPASSSSYEVKLVAVAALKAVPPWPSRKKAVQMIDDELAMMNEPIREER